MSDNERGMSKREGTNQKKPTRKSEQERTI